MRGAASAAASGACSSAGARGGISDDRREELNALLAGTSKGCVHSFERFYDLTHKLGFAVMLRIVVDRAETEELCQELYLKVWLSAASFDAEKAHALTWLYTLARNLAFSSLRMRRARPQAAVTLDEDDPFSQLISPAPGPLDIACQRQLKRLTAAALARLQGEQRQCLNMALSEELTHQALADRMGRPLGTIKSWIRRSRHALQGPLRACL